MNKIDTVNSYWKAEGEKDLVKILSHFADTATFSSPTMKLEGRENIKEFYEGMVNGFKMIEVKPTHWIEQGEEIAVEYDCKLIRNSGEERFARGFNLFTIKEGVIENLRCYFNPADF
ncbi:MAG: nuclear transport factor 2 family protein [Bacteroidota bacterium]